MVDYKMQTKTISIIVLRVLVFLILMFLYLYLGYHLRAYVFSFSHFEFIPHTGQNPSDYIESVGDIGQVISTNSRWVSTIVMMAVMSLLASIMVYILSLKKSHFYIGMMYYTVLIIVCFLYILIGSIVSNAELGYEFARFIKDNFIHTPFVFILLVTSLKVFKV